METTTHEKNIRLRISEREDEKQGRIKQIRSYLARIFHHSRDEKAAKADGARQTQDFYQSCMSPYCPDQNSSLTQQPSAFPAFAVERDEISGLTIKSTKNQGNTKEPNRRYSFFILYC